MSLPTTTEIINFLEDYGVTENIASRDWITARMNGTVIPFIEDKIKMSLESIDTVSEYYSGNGHSTLVLRHKNINEFVSLEFVTYDDNVFELDITSLVVDLEKGIVKRINADFPKGDRNMKLTYKVGQVTIPADLKECVLYLTAELILTFIASRTGGGNPTAQGFSRDYGDRGKWTSLRNDFNRHAMNIMKRYMTGIV